MLTERHLLTIEMREAGETYRAIGEKLGVTPVRARAIYLRALALQTKREGELSARSIGILQSSSHSVAEWQSMLKRDPKATFIALLRLPDCGRWAANEIMEWLTAEHPALPSLNARNASRGPRQT